MFRKLEISGDKIIHCPVNLVSGPMRDADMWRRLDAGSRSNINYGNGIVAYGAGSPLWDLHTIDITYEQRQVGWLIARDYIGIPTTIIGHLKIEDGLEGNGLGKAAHVALQLSLKEGSHLQSSLPRVPAGESIWKSLTEMGLADMTDRGGEAATDRPPTSYIMHTLTS